MVVTYVLPCHPFPIKQRQEEQVSLLTSTETPISAENNKRADRWPEFAEGEENLRELGQAKEQQIDCPFRIETASEVRNVTLGTVTVQVHLNVTEIICDEAIFEIDADYSCKQLKTQVTAFLGLMENTENMDLGDGYFRIGCIKVKKSMGNQVKPIKP